MFNTFKSKSSQVPGPTPECYPAMQALAQGMACSPTGRLAEVERRFNAALDL